ncbi:transmembrane protease serine 9-like [Euwallacea similis]|uniref:transmembrane protease serine 9-like n=1 Tax=Euwallacea similis TaxID=1736056 RepID=UPI00344F6B3E
MTAIKCLYMLMVTVAAISVVTSDFSIIPNFIRSRICRPPLGNTCISIKQCPFFVKLLKETTIPRPKSIIRIMIKHQCGVLENGIPKVCCFVNLEPILTTTTTTQKPVLSVTNKSELPVSIMKFLESTSTVNQLEEHPNFKHLPLERCGSITILENRITDGKKTGLEEFPWMALIAYNSSDAGIEYRCGGTLIQESFILTAAHCILNTSLLGVRLGEYDLSSTNVDCDGTYCSPPVQDFYIERIAVHPKYNPRTHENDIALLKIAGVANFSRSNVQPICLPVAEINGDLTGKFAIVAGWGTTEEDLFSSVLLKASVPVLPEKACSEIYQRYLPVTSDQICAGGYKGRDSCAGDSGGPLMYTGLIEGSPRYIQYGIVSFGPRKCGSEGKPGVYTRVKSYLLWILDNIGSQCKIGIGGLCYLKEKKLPLKLVFDDNGCRTPNKGVGNCLPLSECQSMLDVLTTLKKPISQDVLKRIQAYTCGVAGGTIKVCCPSQSIELHLENVESSNQPPDVSSHRNLNLLPTNCGFIDANNRITNGEDAFLNEFPWMALLRYSSGNKLRFLCGGTIINKNYILTAGHCITNLGSKRLVSVRVGEYDLLNDIDCEVVNKTRKCNPPVQDVMVEEALFHPQYGKGSLGNDIGLIRVSTINLNATNALPVCLPLGKERTKEYSAGFITGWGVTNTTTGATANILQKVRLPVADWNTCARSYLEAESIKLTQNQVCMGGLPGKDSCKGDSGGPMVVPTFNDYYEAIYVQQGIVSFGPRICANEQFPGVYTSIPYYMDWILDTIRP